MGPLEIAACFVEQSQRANSLKHLALNFQNTLDLLGFRHYACGSHVDPLHSGQALMLLNYPLAWVEIYSEQQLHRIDPVFLRAEAAFQPFHWTSEELLPSASRPQRRMLRDATRFGIVSGFTVPVHTPARAGTLRGSCTVIPDSPSLGSHNYIAAQLMTGALFAAAARLQGLDATSVVGPRLTRRQQQCLQLVAEGKSDPVIAQLLGLSAHTVHRHLEDAKLRFNVVTRYQLLVRALVSHQISVSRSHPLAERTKPIKRLLPHGKTGLIRPVHKATTAREPMFLDERNAANDPHSHCREQSSLRVMPGADASASEVHLRR